MTKALTTIPVADLTSVSGGMMFVGDQCIAGCGHKPLTGASAGVTAEQLWSDQLKKRRSY